MFGGHVCAPAILLANEWCGAGVAPEVDVARKVEIERVRHLGKRPVRQTDGLVASRQTLGHSPLHEQGCRTEQDHVQATTVTAVRVPQSLDRFRPVGNLLNLVEREDETSIRTIGLPPGPVPPARQPPRVPFPGD